MPAPLLDREVEPNSVIAFNCWSSTKQLGEPFPSRQYKIGRPFPFLSSPLPSFPAFCWKFLVFKSYLFGPAQNGTAYPRFPGPGVDSVHVSRFWFVPIERLTPVSMHPSFSQICCNIRKVYCRSGFLSPVARYSLLFSVVSGWCRTVVSIDLLIFKVNRI